MKSLVQAYISINHSIDRDPLCILSEVINRSIYPICGRDGEQDYIKLDRIRKIIGCLIETVDRFNNAK